MAELTLTEKVNESLAYIRTKTQRSPKIAIVLGSGLGALGDLLEDKVVIAYKEIPHFSPTTAPGHKGRMIFGKLGGKEVLCLQGRVHYYEGVGMAQVVYSIRVLAKFGIKAILFSNAAGGINTSFQVGDLMLITDHINFMGNNPLIGKNEEEFGPRFNDMSFAYNSRLNDFARKAAKELAINLREGVYVACSGPSYETPAEIRMFRIWGADAVGMSTVPEVIVANQCGICTMAISCITNMAAGILPKPLSEEEVLETGAKSSKKFCALMEKIVAILENEDGVEV